MFVTYTHEINHDHLWWSLNKQVCILLIVNEQQTNFKEINNNRILFFQLNSLHLFILSWYVCIFRYGRMRTGGFRVFEFLSMVDDIAVSASSNWDPVSFPDSGLHFLKGGRVLSWKAVEELAVVRCDITVVLSGESVSSTSKWDPVWVSKQWPGFFESGRVLSWQTVTGLTIIEWDVASDSHLGICEKPMGPASPASTAWAVLKWW